MSSSDLEKATDAKSVQARAAEWVAERQYKENWSAEDQAALDAWLAEDFAHEIAYWRLDAAWERTNRLAAMRRKSVPNHQSSGFWLRSHLGKLVAVLIGGAVVGATFFYQVSPRGASTYATPIGGQKILSLSDGSRITLNTDSSIRIRTNGSSREAWLDRGEAFFEIRHDSARPFVVITAGHRITDLGTKFSVRNQSDGLGLKIAVVEGLAEIDSAAAWVSNHRAILKPGDVAVATAHTIAVSREPTAAITEDLTWRQGLLVFRHTTLAEVVAEFNRYNDQKISIADSEVGDMRIAGTFQARNTELFTEAVKELFKLRVSRSGDQTIISR